MSSADDTYRKMFTVSWQELHRDCKALAWKLVAGGPWRGIVAVTRGGLIPAGIIARELELRIIDTVSIATYQGQQIGDTSNILKPLATTTVDANSGPRWLIIDDLRDRGEPGYLDHVPVGYRAAIRAAHCRPALRGHGLTRGRA